MLKVYGRRSAFNVQKVAWFVGELGIPHEHIELGGSFGGLDDPAYRKLNPHGRVPLIDDGGTIVWESHSVLRYLAATYGRDSFWSDDPAKRAKWEPWMDWALCTLQPAFLTGVFWGFYRTPEAQRDVATVNAKIAACGRYMQLLDEAIGDNEYLLGDEISLADVTIGVNFFRYFYIDIERPDVPNVERSFANLATRPAYRAHVMLPFNDMYGRLSY
jgi:glutathione S-transferase